MSNEDGYRSVSLGKLRRLALLADHDGHLQVVAADGIAALRSRLAAQMDVEPEAVGYPALAEAKELVGRVLSTQASAVVLDPQTGLAHAVPSMDRGAAVVAALDADEGPHGLALLAEWSVAKALRCGAAAVKVGLCWTDDGEARERALAALEMVGDECAKHELPLLVQVSGPIGDALREAAERLSSGDYQIDLLALPPVEGLDPACAVPWLAVLDQDSPSARAGALELAAGASGFLLGPAAWERAFEEYPNLEGVEAWLLAEALPELRRLIAATGGARAWFDHPRYGGLDRLRAAGAGEDWFRTY